MNSFMNIVLIHGLAGSHYYFEQLEKELKEKVGANVFSFDLSGFGKNVYINPNSSFGLDEHLSFIDLKIKERFGGEQVILIGHSMGGILSLALAAKFPSRIDKIVLLNTPIARDKEEIFQAMQKNFFSWEYWMVGYPKIANMACNLLCQKGGRNLFKFLKPKYISDNIFEAYTQHSWQSVSKTFKNIILDYPLLSLIKFMPRIPILQLVGNHDTPLTKKLLHLPFVQKIEIDGGHHILLENPKETTKKIITFLNNNSR